MFCYGYCGDDLAIHEKFLNNNNSYCSGNGDYYHSFETNNLKMIGKDIKGKVNFIISELEVYKVCCNETEFHKDLSTLKEETVKISHGLTDNQSIMDSLIIKEEKNITMLKNWINPNNSINFELLYRATRDGDSLNDFHLKCDNESPTITIIKTENGKIIGGYTKIPWIREDKAFIKDENTFIFSVDSKEKYNVKKELNGKYAVYHCLSSYCCCFGYCGDDLAIGDKFLQGRNSYCAGNAGGYYTFEASNDKMLGVSEKGKTEFKISELEIFKINFTK